MAKQNKKSPGELRVERMREKIAYAQGTLSYSLLHYVLDAVEIVECVGEPGDPLYACVDSEQGVLWVNPYAKGELTAPEWTFVIAHQLLHLALNHAARCEDREPLLWNLACNYAAESLLKTLGIGTTPEGIVSDSAFSKVSEEDIYEVLTGDTLILTKWRTFAGEKRPDMVSRKPLHSPYDPGILKRRRDYAHLFAQGIREAVQSAVEGAADTLGDDNTERNRLWRPVEAARRWVINELPLLGALAAQLRVIADPQLCQRLDIGVAAVDASLGEIYFNSDRSLTDEEVRFIYVHELLHVGLMHHARLQGRDPWLWNVAADFVINGWLIEMGVGKFPSVGGLYDPRLQGMGAEEVYDLLLSDPKRCKGLRGFRGKLGDIILDGAGRKIYRGDIMTLDDVYRRCMAAGLSCAGYGRGTVPAGLMEEVRSLFTPPVPWDVELARWMEQHVPMIRDPLRSYARASRRQASTPDIPRPARYVPQEMRDACTFGVVLDTSGSMDREMLGRALGAIASYAEAREVPAIRLVLCDATPYDKGIVSPTDLRGIFSIQGRGGTVLQPALNFLLTRPDFPTTAPIMIITDGWCEETLICPREHCFVLPRKGYSEGNGMPLKTSAPTFRVLKEEV